MSKLFTPTKSAMDWRELLADPIKQWSPGYSAKTLAYCWEENPNDFPNCVKNVFNKSSKSTFQNMKLLFGFPEYKVHLPGGNRPSQNDIFVIAKGEEGLISIMVEGKVSESFDKTVEDWLGKAPSDGKRERLAFLTNELQLKSNNVSNIRYQLLHRTVSSVLEAKKLNIPNALMLVHSFSESYEGFDDYYAFAKLLGLHASKEDIIGPVYLNGINVYLGWVTGDRKFLLK
ncbi:hypothetical protein HNQ94_000022 [Salirhabdus euzebyi]|uniref:DUF6946 domain-containing protein n=1 Tax=Salirhabdus euzebyi TaxID=394506 RepID=A0A841PXU4_9BACI|nr:hypothetical protein [Salirhabdus euzebyi]MBB6451601.1 hypothetical protein [Salirhabdus euzebyi]